MKYRTLILGCGLHECTRLPRFIVQFSDGEDTPEELLSSFAGAVHALIAAEMAAEFFEESTQLQAMTHCPACNTQFAERARYCHRCGYRKKEAEPATAEEIREAAAVKFQSWFDQELHEFSDWENLHDLGWETGCMGVGGFVHADGFDRYLLDMDMKALIEEATVGVITEVTTRGD